MHDQNSPPYWNPYVAGFALGLVLLATFLVMGFGLGASGAATRFGVGATYVIAPQVAENPYFARYVGHGQNPLDDWLVFEVVGVFLGGLLAAYTAGRYRAGVTMGEGRQVSVRTRLFLALLGGILMGIGARLARGCTSGQALSGGSLFSLGSWVFMMAVFVGGYAIAPLMRRQWR